MSDNVTINGIPVATDEIGGFNYQRFKPAFGVDGVAVDVSASNPLPVAAIGNVAVVDGGGSLTVDGPLTNTELRAAPVAVTGSFSTTVSGTYNTSPPTLTNGQTSGLQMDAAASLKVTGPLTDTQLRAAPVPVTGSFSASLTATYNVSPPTLTNGQTSGFQCDANGNLKTYLANANANGQATSANSAPVVLPSDWIGTVGGISGVASASFTRPANTTAYASGQLVANNTTAGSVVPVPLSVARVAGGTGAIRRGRLTKSGTTTTNASFRAHFYKTSPSSAVGDGGTYSTDQALSYMGSMDFDMTGSNARVFTDGTKCISVPNVGSDILFDTNGGVTTIYALLEARAAYTPVSAEVFTLAVEVLKD